MEMVIFGTVLSLMAYLTLGLCVFFIISRTILNKICDNGSQSYLWNTLHGITLRKFIEVPIGWRFTAILSLWPIYVIFVSMFYLGLAYYYRFIAKGRLDFYLHAHFNNIS